MLFSETDPEDIERIVDAMDEKKVLSQEVVITEGQEGDYFYVIESGNYTASKGGQSVFTYEGKGSFGELALMYNCPRAATVTADTDGVIWALDRMTFRKVRGFTNVTLIKMLLAHRITGSPHCIFGGEIRAHIRGHMLLTRVLSVGASSFDSVSSTHTRTHDNIQIIMTSNIKKRERFERVLNNVECLKSMTESEKSLIADVVVGATYSKDQRVFDIGNPLGDEGKFYVVEQGSVKIMDSSGNEDVATKLGAGDVFGHIELLDEDLISRVTAAVVMEDNTKVLVMQGDSFKRLIAEGNSHIFTPEAPLSI